MWNMNETSFRVDCVKVRVIVTKMKYVNSYSSVLEAFETSVQNSDIDEKKSESEVKKFQLDENVMRFNALFATMSHDDF